MREGKVAEVNSVICLSGGLDSTVLAYDLLDQGHCLHTLTFHYGQSHRREMDAARGIADLLGVSNKTVDFEPVTGRGKSSLTGGEGSPVVANRNSTMLSLAVTYAAGVGASQVYYCPTSEDYDLFPDCRPQFVSVYNRMLEVSECETRVIAPYITISKAEIVKIGRRLDVPFDETWSCYVGGEKPCGECLACKTRGEALACS